MKLYSITVLFLFLVILSACSISFDVNDLRAQYTGYDVKGALSACEKEIEIRTKNPNGLCGMRPSDVDSAFAKACEDAGYSKIYCGCEEGRILCPRPLN